MEIPSLQGFEFDRDPLVFDLGCDLHHLPDRIRHHALTSDQTADIIVGSIDIEQDLIFVEALHLLHGDAVFLVADRSDQIQKRILQVDHAYFDSANFFMIPA